MWLHEASCLYDGGLTFLVGLHHEFAKLFSGKFFRCPQTQSVDNFRSGLHHASPIPIMSLAALACSARARRASCSCRDHWHHGKVGNPNFSCLSQRPRKTHVDLCAHMFLARQNFFMTRTKTSNRPLPCSLACFCLFAKLAVDAETLPPNQQLCVTVGHNCAALS